MNLQKIDSNRVRALWLHGYEERKMESGESWGRRWYLSHLSRFDLPLNDWFKVLTVNEDC